MYKINTNNDNDNDAEIMKYFITFFLLLKTAVETQQVFFIRIRFCQWRTSSYMPSPYSKCPSFPFGAKYRWEIVVSFPYSQRKYLLS